jgi:hypothetical protein
MKKVIFFTAGTKATAGELADIAKLNAVAEAQYSVQVVNGAVPAIYGETDRIIPDVDYVAGTIPELYEEIDEIDPDDIPNQALTSTQAIVENAQKIAGVTGSGTFANIAVNPTTKAVTITLSAS